MLTSAKMIKLAGASIEGFKKDSKNPDILFYLENGLNSHASTIEIIDEILLNI